MLVEVLQELSFSQFCFKSDLLFAEETLKLIVGNTFRNLLGSKFFSSVGGSSSSFGADLALLEMHSRFFFLLHSAEGFWWNLLKWNHRIILYQIVEEFRWSSIGPHFYWLNILWDQNNPACWPGLVQSSRAEGSPLNISANFKAARHHLILFF